jgi:uncharacterized oligopeptide transporter (OPT) family protein
MKTSSVPPNQPVPKRPPAVLWALVNQLAFPGLGTLMMGRRVGFAQAVIMLTGFFLTMGYLFWYLISAGRYAANPSWDETQFASLYRPYKWSLYWGLGLCAVSWVWALFSSIAMLRAARSEAQSA